MSVRFRGNSFKRVSVLADDIAQVVGIRSIGQHVGDLELLAAFGVRIAGHHDRHFSTSQIVGPRSPP